MELSRRNFLKGSLAAGMVAAGSAAIAGCAPAGKGAEASAKGAGSDTLATTGEKVCEGGWSWSYKPEPTTDFSETVDCDICVVGLGGAGVPATLYAALSGAKTVVLQKEASVCFNGSAIGGWNDAHEDEVGVKCDVAVDMAKFANEASDGFSNLQLVSNIMSKTGEVVDFMTSIVTEPPVVVSANGNHVRHQWAADPATADMASGSDDTIKGIQAFFNNLVDRAVEEGADIRYSTPAVQLVTDESGAVVGVVGQKEDGSYLLVNAAKGVIMCSGDCSQDDEMKAAYCPGVLGAFVRCAHRNTGDGTKMGLWAGAAMEECASNLQISTAPRVGDTSHFPPFNNIPWLMVNENGDRFVNEETANVWIYSTSMAIQPEGYGFAITDAHYAENVDKFTVGVKSTQEQIDQGFEEGKVFKADTLEELADAAGIDADALKKTVERFNGLVEKGSDTDFGLSAENLALCGIKDAPFYAIRREASVLGVGIGLKCNEFCQVLGTDSEPLGGLYAAGAPQGNFFGYLYPGTGFGGLSLGRSFTGGVMAVKHALGTFDEPVAL